MVNVDSVELENITVTSPQPPVLHPSEIPRTGRATELLEFILLSEYSEDSLQDVDALQPY